MQKTKVSQGRQNISPSHVRQAAWYFLVYKHDDKVDHDHSEWYAATPCYSGSDNQIWIHSSGVSIPACQVTRFLIMIFTQPSYLLNYFCCPCFILCALFSDEVHVLKSPKVERRYLARSLGAYEINVRRWEIKIIGFILFIGWSICSDSQINMRLCGILRRQLDDSWQSGSRTTGANLDEYIFWTRSKR